MELRHRRKKSYNSYAFDIKTPPSAVLLPLQRLCLPLSCRRRHHQMVVAGRLIEK
ncbi:hypothetical protein Hanom_Chr15g01407811 [Helianthus anomalus]